MVYFRDLTTCEWVRLLDSCQCDSTDPYRPSSICTGRDDMSWGFGKGRHAVLPLESWLMVHAGLTDQKHTAITMQPVMLKAKVRRTSSRWRRQSVKEGFLEQQHLRRVWKDKQERVFSHGGPFGGLGVGLLSHWFCI